MTSLFCISTRILHCMALTLFVKIFSRYLPLQLLVVRPLGGGHHWRLPSHGRLSSDLRQEPRGTERVLGSPAGEGLRQVSSPSMSRCWWRQFTLRHCCDQCESSYKYNFNLSFGVESSDRVGMQWMKLCFNEMTQFPSIFHIKNKGEPKCAPICV